MHKKITRLLLASSQQVPYLYVLCLNSHLLHLLLPFSSVQSFD